MFAYNIVRMHIHDSMHKVQPPTSKAHLCHSHASLLESYHQLNLLPTLQDKYELIADAPGMAPDEVNIELNEGVLTISGSHSHEKKQEEAVLAEAGGAGAEGKQGGGRKVLRSERTSYQFCRTFVLPDNANPEAISAGLDQGVLRVSIHKRPEPPKPEPKRIAVNAH